MSKGLEDRLIGRKWEELTRDELREAQLSGYIGAILFCPYSDEKGKTPSNKKWEIIGIYHSDQKMHDALFEYLETKKVRYEYFILGGMSDMFR